MTAWAGQNLAWGQQNRGLGTKTFVVGGFGRCNAGDQLRQLEIALKGGQDPNKNLSRPLPTYHTWSPVPTGSWPQQRGGGTVVDNFWRRRARTSPPSQHNRIWPAGFCPPQPRQPGTSGQWRVLESRTMALPSPVMSMPGPLSVPFDAVIITALEAAIDNGNAGVFLLPPVRHWRRNGAALVEYPAKVLRWCTAKVLCWCSTPLKYCNTGEPVLQWWTTLPECCKNGRSSYSP